MVVCCDSGRESTSFAKHTSAPLLLLILGSIRIHNPMHALSMLSLWCCTSGHTVWNLLADHSLSMGHGASSRCTTGYLVSASLLVYHLALVQSIFCDKCRNSHLQLEGVPACHWVFRIHLHTACCHLWSGLSTMCLWPLGSHVTGMSTFTLFYSVWVHMSHQMAATLNTLLYVEALYSCCGVHWSVSCSCFAAWQCKHDYMEVAVHVAGLAGYYCPSSGSYSLVILLISCLQDPLGDGNQASVIALDIRKRKGLKPNPAPLNEYEDKL